MNNVIKNKRSFPIKIWADYVDDKTQEQLSNIGRLPFIHKHIAVMPDCHFGKGSTIGSVIPTIKAIIPSAVGVDIGCGIIAQQTNLTSKDLPDNLYDLRMIIEKNIPMVMFDKDTELTSNIKDKYMLNQGNFIGSFLNRMNDFYDRKLGVYHEKWHSQIGSLGGGNHFIEICLDELDKVWIMIHSGSRGMGNTIGRKFIEKAKMNMEKFFITLPDKDLSYIPEDTQLFKDYYYSVEIAQKYAKINRLVMMDVVKQILTNVI